MQLKGEIMSNKKASSEPMMGEFIVPLVDGLSVLLMKLIELAGMGLNFLINRYVFNRRPHESLKKIEREDLKSKRTTLLEDAIGYSVTRKRNIWGGEINRSAHTAIIGASGSGKTVLLDRLMYEDMKAGKNRGRTTLST